MDPKRCQKNGVNSSWARLELQDDISWVFVGLSGPKLAPKWPQVGPKRPQLGPKLAANWLKLASFSVINQLSKSVNLSINISGFFNPQIWRNEQMLFYMLFLLFVMCSV